MRGLRLLPLLAAFLVPNLAHANAIANGDFLSTCVSGSFCTYYAGDSVDITSWTVTNGGNPIDHNGSVDLITGYWQSPPGSGNSVDLDGNAFGGISQTFATISGKQYLVSFFLSGNPDGAPGTKALDVTAGLASQTFLYTVTGSKGSMNWLSEDFTFLATSALTTLSFTSLDATSGFYGPAIGNADVEPVPEPRSLFILALLLLSLGGVLMAYPTIAGAGANKTKP